MSTEDKHEQEAAQDPEQRVENTPRPREVGLLVNILALLESTRIIAMLLFSLEFGPMADDLSFRGLYPLRWSILSLIGLYGIWRLKNWGVYLFVGVQLISSIAAIRDPHTPLTSLVFSLLLLCIACAVIIPSRKAFK